MWSFLTAFAALGGVGVAAVCGWQLPDVLKGVRDILNDLYQYLRTRKEPALTALIRKEIQRSELLLSTLHNFVNRVGSEARRMI